MILNMKYKKRILLAMAGILIAFSHADSRKEVSAAVADAKSTSSAAKSADTKMEASLYPIHVMTKGEELYGYIDSTGSVVIDPQYMAAGNFSEGLAIVNQDNRYFVINTKGEVVLRTTNYLNDFHQGLASFLDSKTYKSGYINTEGKVVMKAAYDYAGNFDKNNTAIVAKEGKYYRINKQGKILKAYSLPSENYYYDITDDGYVIFTNTTTFLKGVKDLNGKIILKDNYSQITYLGEGLFGVKEKLPDAESYRANIMPAALFNKSGKQLTPYKFYDLSVYNNKYASCTDSKNTYLINTKGKIITSIPKQEGRGSLTVLGNVVQADIDNKLSYLALDGSLIWKASEVTTLSNGSTIRSVKVKPNKYDVIYYPELEGLSNAEVQTQINNKLKNLFTAHRLKLTEKDELMVEDNFFAEQFNDLLMICKTGYDYPVGAAHGTPFRLYYFINTQTGDFYQFKDLFLKDSNYIKTLDNIVRKQMKAQEKKEGITYDAKDGTYISENQFFYLGKDALTIYFDSGEIAPYAAGFPKFEIPFSQISDLINTEGEFWKAFQK